MKKIIIAIIAPAVAGIVIYFLFQQQSNAVVNSGSKIKNEQAANSPNDAKIKNNTDSDNKNPYVGDDFTLTPPEEWVQIELPSTLAAYQNKKEVFAPGSAADKIHFKSYFAVSFDNANGQTIEEITDLVKKQTASVAPSINFTSVSETTIHGLPAKMVEANLTMQNIDFKLLIAIIMNDDKYYTISFNTTADKWTEYKDMFYKTANSFEQKTIPSAGHRQACNEFSEKEN